MDRSRQWQSSTCSSTDCLHHDPVLSVYLLHPDPGPACRGHTLKEWLVIYSECKDAKNLVRGGFVRVTPEDIQAADNCRLAREAIKQIGTKALPYLLRWIQSENRIDALALKLPDKIRRHPRLNPILFRSTTSADDADRAIMGFEALGLWPCQRSRNWSE